MINKCAAPVYFFEINLAGLKSFTTFVTSFRAAEGASGTRVLWLSVARLLDASARSKSMISPPIPWPGLGRKSKFHLYL